MSENPNAADRDSETSHIRERSVATHAVPDAPELELRVVEYPDRPDRCTLCPRQATGFERMVTWLSVDREAVVELDAWR